MSDKQETTFPQKKETTDDIISSIFSVIFAAYNQII